MFKKAAFGGNPMAKRSSSASLPCTGPGWVFLTQPRVACWRPTVLPMYAVASRFGTANACCNPAASHPEIRNTAASSSADPALRPYWGFCEESWESRCWWFDARALSVTTLTALAPKDCAACVIFTVLATVGVLALHHAAARGIAARAEFGMLRLRRHAGE
jgi:hypothetical protein